MSLDESWQRYPEARIRMREQDLAILIKALGEGGVFISGQPRVQLLDDGILINFSTNAGTYGKLIALPIDVFIPCEVTRVQEEGSEEGRGEAGRPVDPGDDSQPPEAPAGAGGGEREGE